MLTFSWTFTSLYSPTHVVKEAPQQLEMLIPLQGTWGQWVHG